MRLTTKLSACICQVVIPSASGTAATAGVGLELNTAPEAPALCMAVSSAHVSMGCEVLAVRVRVLVKREGGRAGSRGGGSEEEVDRSKGSSAEEIEAGNTKSGAAGGGGEVEAINMTVVDCCSTEMCTGNQLLYSAVSDADTSEEEEGVALQSADGSCAPEESEVRWAKGATPSSAGNSSE